MGIRVKVNGAVQDFAGPAALLDQKIDEKFQVKIKKKNKGKFTAAAKKAGMDVQSYATKVLNDPDASPQLKKRANFAKNAAGWKN